ncbi:MAG: hypothetical protein HXX16_16240 [Bacteroidales bacterium]|nr:hypothetical protein [Bacteroidales bacterium]
MNQLIFFLTLIVLLLLIIYLDRKYKLLRDISISDKKPFSYSRVQLAWWTWIIVTAFITIIFANGGNIPVLDSSTLILMGISAGTTSVASIIDVSDAADKTRHQDERGKHFLYDIIDDSNGASIHRLQAVLFNIIFGVWMLITVYNKMECIPPINTNCLILLGISAGTYSVVKTSENKQTNSTAGTNTADSSK